MLERIYNYAYASTIVHFIRYQAQTQYSEKAVSVLRTLANGTVVTVSETVRVKSNSKTDSVNVLGR